MKTKYYLRGLGIGIILATLILTISGNQNNLSEDEIITKAMELGMVMKEDPKGNLDEVMEGDLTKAPEATPTTEPTQSPEATPTAEPTKAPEVAPTTAPTKDPAIADDSRQITFTIEKGMSSGKVAELLQSIDLIDNAKEFNDYVIREGKAGAIMIGKYTVSKDASFDDILNAITKR